MDQKDPTDPYAQCILKPNHLQQALQILGTQDSPAAYDLRDFLQRSDVRFDWVDLRTDEQARDLAGVENLADPRLPLCIFPDGTRMEHPTIRQITEHLGWFRKPTETEYDLVILGAGPAGLSAAVYGASEGLKTLVIEKSAVGGQAGTSSRIENYLGFPQGISGAELAHRAREQACHFGAEILILREGVGAEFTPGRNTGYLGDGTSFIMRSAISAAGVEYRRLNLWNEDRLRGSGVYYGAGSSEAALCSDDHVFVVGGGNSAGQAAMFFARTARKVSIVIRGDNLKDTLSDYLLTRILTSSNIEILPHTEVTELHGEKMLEAITLTNNITGQEQTVKTNWLFLCLGGVPNQLSSDKKPGVMRDPQGYIVTGPDLDRYKTDGWQWPLERRPYFLETSVPGLFAAGDIRHGSIKRCAAAVGEGAMAVAFVHKYLAEL